MTGKSGIGLLGAAAVIAFIGLPGCGPKSGTAPPGGAGAGSAPATAGGGAEFKVALVESDTQSDNGWNSNGAKALEAVKRDLNLPDDDVKLVDNQKDATSQAKSLEDFASKKYSIVFGHGTEYEAPALRIESNFPKTLFIISAGSKAGKNTMPIIFKLEDGAYLEGMLAAGMSKTGKVGSVGATQDESLERVFKAFEKGARTINPKIEVIPPAYTGSWDDPSKAKQQTLALLNQGADVIMQDVDSAAKGVFNAVEEFNKAGKQAYALGTNGDQNASAPDVVLASAPIYIDKAFVPIAKAARAGTLKISDAPFGMKEGVIDFVVNPELKSRIPQTLLTDLESVKKEITDGSLDVSK